MTLQYDQRFERRPAWECGVKPRRVDAATRVTLTLPSRWFDWRSALVVVQPGTLIRWHRVGIAVAREPGLRGQSKAGNTPRDPRCFVVGDRAWGAVRRFAIPVAAAVW
jgi:hypothetical protein